MKNILSYIERSAERFPENTAVADDKNAYTYKQLIKNSKKIGSFIFSSNKRNCPIAVYMDKTPACAAAMLGVAYSGNFYVVIDTLMPKERISKIFESLHPSAVIADSSRIEQAKNLDFDGQIIDFEKALSVDINEDSLSAVRASMTENDPLYVLYTSGSTGRPKGAVISHRSVIAYSNWVIETFKISETTVFGSQTPFYFSMSVTDLFSSLFTGGRLQIIPKALFSFPQMLIDYMNKFRINAIYWVPSALCIVANWKTFDYIKPEHLEMVLFAGEVMPIKQLNYWMDSLPGIFYANLFGPTETTDICTYYVVNRKFPDNSSLPIGSPCDNCRVSIVGEDGKSSDCGELYVGGPFLADGYYNDPEKTASAFVQNPLNTAFPEVVYKTGDLVKVNELGELIYLGRKDFQIKHMGYRIELGEIESNVSAADGVDSCVCCYDAAEDKIILLYQGKAKEDKLSSALRDKLPNYMYPNKMIRLKAMPFNANGKIDRSYIKNHYKEF